MQDFIFLLLRPEELAIVALIAALLFAGAVRIMVRQSAGTRSPAEQRWWRWIKAGLTLTIIGSAALAATLKLLQVAGGPFPQNISLALGFFMFGGYLAFGSGILAALIGAIGVVFALASSGKLPPK